MADTFLKHWIPSILHYTFHKIKYGKTFLICTTQLFLSLPSILVLFNATKLVLYFCVYKFYQTADIVILLTSCYVEDVSAYLLTYSMEQSPS